jgi:glutamine synthetase
MLAAKVQNIPMSDGSGFPALDASDLDPAAGRLQEAGVRLVIGSMVNAAGITLAKSVPVARLGSFHRAGMGAAPVWHVFCIDGEIAFTDNISAVGDLRLRIDPNGLRSLGSGLAWAPADMFLQDGSRDPACARGTLARVQERAGNAGYRALVGHELEFMLVAGDGTALDDAPWAPYGLTGLLDREHFLAELLAAMNDSGAQVEQLHAEYGRNQFEVSLAPRDPLAAADTVVLAKIVVGRVARAHKLQASFSPAPFPGSVGNGAHQHFSLYRGVAPLFSGGAGPHGITEEGGAAIGGIIQGLPEVQGLLTGSILSGIRLAPGAWSGAFLCWGLENREASVRFVEGGVGNPHGASVEVKVIDPSANVYLASAAILAVALEGITSGSRPPDEVPGDPSRLTAAEREAAGIGTVSDSPAAIITSLDNSVYARRLLGNEVVDTTVAVRRHEQETHGARDPKELAALFRLAWSI